MGRYKVKEIIMFPGLRREYCLWRNLFVVSDVEGLREVTKGYGVLFPHGDSKALAEVIQKLCTDNTYREEVVNKCRERALQYDIRKMAEGYLEAYEGLSLGLAKEDMWACRMNTGNLGAPIFHFEVIQVSSPESPASM